MIQEKIDKAQSLVGEAQKLLLEVLLEITKINSGYSDSYVDRIYDASKTLKDVTQKID